MSTYTPCFPPTNVVPSGRRGPIPLSNSSGTSISESHSLPKLSYSARLSRSHLALASVSEYISRPPSPTSAAVDSKRVTQLRRKFRLAVDATYRDTSSGKWGHVSEMAKLGSTRGRWQGMCSGSSALRSLYKAHEQKDQGMTAAESADPYPRPPDPVFDFREIRERVENWKVNVLSAPLSQADSQDTELNRPVPVGDVRQPSQLDFPTVKQRRSDVVKTMKRKNSPSRKGHSTSRYFRAVTAPKSPDAANRGTDITTSLSQPQGLNVDSMLHYSPASALDADSVIARRPSHITVTAAGRGNIQQVSEHFLPPSFPSHLRTSTPPALANADSAHFRLTKPPEIPRRDVSVPLPSPPPFPLSQAISGDPRSESQRGGTPSPSRRKRSLQDETSPTRFPTRLSQQRRESSCFEKPGPSPKPSSHKLHADLRGSDLDLSPMPDHHAHVPVIDLRQLVTSQRPRSQPRHSSLGISLTPKTKDKGKGLAMMVDISPSQQNLLSPPLSSKSLSLASSPPLRMPPLSQITLFRDEGTFAPVATSTQPPPGI